MIEKKVNEEDIKKKETALSEWLADEEKARAQTRRCDAVEKQQEHEKEAQRQKSIEHAIKMEEARKQQLNKKKSKSKGRGKNK